MDEPAPANPTAVAFAYTLVCIVWGSTYLFIRLGVEVLPPYLLGGVRFSIAGIVLIAACLAGGRPLPRDRRILARIVMLAILLLVLGNGLLNVSEQHLSSGLAALLVVTTPLWIPLLAMVGAGRERLSPLGWLGLMVGFAGIMILIRPMDGGVESSWVGVAAVLTASFAWAVGTVYHRRRMRGVDPFAASAVETAIAGPLMLGVHLLLERGQPVMWNGQAWIAVVYLATMGSLVGFTAFVFITHHLPSSKAGTYAFVNPVVAVLLGWWFLEEPITWRLAVGGGTILVGLLLLYLARVDEGGAAAGPTLRGSAPSSR